MKKKITCIGILSILLLTSFAALPTISSQNGDTCSKSLDLVKSATDDGPYIDYAWSRTISNVVTTSDLESSWAGAESYYSACFGSRMKRCNDGSIICEIAASYKGTGDGSCSDRYLIWSYDNGRTWTAPVPFLDGHHEFGDDIALGGKFAIDNNGRLWALITVDFYPSPYAYNYAIYSEDNGHTWTGVDSNTKFINSQALDITAKAQLSELSHSRNGFFNNGIVTDNGRMIFVGWMNGHGQGSNLFSIWTDNPNAGRQSTWHHSAEFGLDTEYSESAIVLLEDGDVYATIRDNAKEGGTPRRFASWCENAGYGTMSWSEPVATELSDPESFADMKRWTTDDYDKNRVVLCWNNNPSSRSDLTLAISYDECQSWTYSRKISDYNSPKACITENMTILTSYVKSWSQKSVDFFQCNIEWITHGWDQINGELTADAGGPYSGTPSIDIQFNGRAYGGTSPYTYSWDFDVDDGIQVDSTKQNPTHAYTTEGEYTATLTVADNDGEKDDDTTTVTITINTPPANPTITGLTDGQAGTEYEYTISTTDPDEDNIYYYIDWGDEDKDEWIGPYESDEEISAKHTWNEKRIYTIKVKAKDIFDEESDWTTLEITMPRDKTMTKLIFIKFFELFPLLQHLLNLPVFQ